MMMMMQTTKSNTYMII